MSGIRIWAVSGLDPIVGVCVQGIWGGLCISGVWDNSKVA